MRRGLLVVALLAPAAVGCVGGSEDVDTAAGGAPNGSAPPAPEAPEPLAYLVCEDGLEPLDGGHDSGCNTRVTHDSGPAAEVDVAVNPTDPTNLLGGSKDFTLQDGPPCDEHNVWSGVYVSEDGGRTWNHSLLPGHPGDDRETALSAYDCGSDPVIAFGPNGTAYYASIHVSSEDEDPTVPVDTFFTGSAGTRNASLAVTRSTDGGHTWEDPVVLIHREDGSIIDKQWMAVDQETGQVYLSYYDTGDGNLEVVRSDDRARTWTDPVTVVPGAGEEDEPAHAHQFAQVGVAPDGTVHLIYWATQESRGVSGI